MSLVKRSLKLLTILEVPLAYLAQYGGFLPETDLVLDQEVKKALAANLRLYKPFVKPPRTKMVPRIAAGLHGIGRASDGPRRTSCACPPDLLDLSDAGLVPWFSPDSQERWITTSGSRHGVTVSL